MEDLKISERLNSIHGEQDAALIKALVSYMNTKAEGVEMAEHGHTKEDSSVPQVNKWSYGKTEKIYGQFGITESYINKVADGMNLKV